MHVCSVSNEAHTHLSTSGMDSESCSKGVSQSWFYLSVFSSCRLIPCCKEELELKKEKGKWKKTSKAIHINRG